MPRILLINLGHMATHLLMLLFPVVAALAADELGGTYGELLTLSTGGFIAFGLGSLPAGWLADRWSRNGMIGVFFFGSALGCFLTGMASSNLEIAGGLLVIGIFVSIYHPVGISILTEYGGQLGRRLGINGVAGNFGIAISTLAAAWLADTFGWRAAFMVPGAVCLILGLIWIQVVRRAAPVVAEAGGEGDQKVPVTMDSVPVSWKRALAVVVATTIFGGFAFNGVTVSLPEVFDERLVDLTDTALGIGGIAMAIYVLAAFSQIVVGHAIDRYPIRPIFMTIAALEAVAFFVAMQSDGYVLIGAALVIMVMVFGAQPVGDVLIARNTPDVWRSRVYATNYLFAFGAAAIAIPSIAGIHEHGGGFPTIFAVFTGCAVVVTICVMLLPGSSILAPDATPAA